MLHDPNGRSSVSVAEPLRVLVALTNASDAYAETKVASLEPKVVPVALAHVTWRAVRDMAVAARVAATTNAAKRALQEFSGYLEGVLSMETRFSNYVYVVSLAAGNEDGWAISWRDIVNVRRRYFYPVGSGGWPDPPPNYMAFRYDGKLQSIHHVTEWEVFEDPRTIFPEAPVGQRWPAFYCLRLGPPIVPPHDVKNGTSVQRSMRCWVMIDTLLTCTTITEALQETKRREQAP